MKTSARLPLLILSSLLFLLAGVPALAQEKFTYNGPVITLRYSTYVPETHPSTKVAKKWIEMVEQESNGKVKIKAFYSGVLHSAKDGFKAAVSDITDFSPAYTIYQPASFHLTHVLELPFAFKNAAVASKVAEELYPKYFKKEYEGMGVYLANFNAITPANIFTKKPVNTLEDLKGMKIRSAGGGESAVMLKALGAVPVAMPSSESYTAFQRGTVDGVASYNTGAVGYRFDELATHMKEVHLNISGIAWAFNRKTFDGLPPELKRFMYNLQRRLSMMYGIDFDREDSISRKSFVARGMKIIEQG